MKIWKTIKTILYYIFWPFVMLYKGLQKIDMTGKVLEMYVWLKKQKGVRFFGFIVFFMVGLFGLLVPIIQGVPTLLLSLTFLLPGLFDDFIVENKDKISAVMTVFLVFAASWFVNLEFQYLTGNNDEPPVRGFVNDLIDVLTVGQNQLKQFNQVSFSLISDSTYNPSKFSLLGKYEPVNETNSTVRE